MLLKYTHYAGMERESEQKNDFFYAWTAIQGDFFRAEPEIVAYLYGGQGTINVPSWSPESRKVSFVSNSGRFYLFLLM